jgi:hypothetical protein
VVRREEIAWVAAAAVAVSVACGSSGGRSAGNAASNPDQTTVPHADHNPRHGGIVLMHGDLHYEAVLKRDGRYQLYFSDARRAPLPATVASTVTITITRRREPAEVVALQIAGDGESWTAEGRPVGEPDATVRIAYEIDGRTYWIDLPFELPAPGRS